jgi:hypothetical protein
MFNDEDRLECGATRTEYIAACVKSMLRDTPERRAELLAMLTDDRWPGWRKDFEAEIARQEGSEDVR